LSKTSPSQDVPSHWRDRIPPLVRRIGSKDPERRSRDEMALKVEGVVYGGVHAGETLSGSSRFEALKLALSSLQHPASDGFVGDVEPTLGEQILHVSVAQRKGQVEPYSVLDDNRRKTVAAIRNFSHRASVPATSLPSHIVILTMPLQHFRPAHPRPPSEAF
jgi:hypothetical protein